MRSNYFVCMEKTTKNLMMRTGLLLKFPIETLHIPKTWNNHLSKTYIYTRMYVYYLGMCDSEEIIQFCVQLIRSDAKNKIIINMYIEITSKQGKSVYSCHIQRSFPKILFCYCPYIIACFHEPLLPQLYLGEKLCRFQYDGQFALRAIRDYEPSRY